MRPINHPQINLIVEVIHRFKSGESAYSLAKKYGFHRSVILRWAKRGIPKLLQTRVPLLTKVERAYLAGILDGEGTISIYRDTKTWGKRNRRIFPEISVASTNRDLIKLLIEKYRFKPRQKDVNKGKPNRRQLIRVSMRKLADVYEILVQIEPLLIIKKKHAKIVLEYINTRINKLLHGVKTKSYGQEEEEFLKKIRVLNIRGTNQPKTR